MHGLSGTPTNIYGDFSLGAVVVVDGFKKFGVEVGPVLEGEVFAENAGIDA